MSEIILLCIDIGQVYIVVNDNKSHVKETFISITKQIYITFTKWFFKWVHSVLTRHICIIYFTCKI